MAIKVILAYGLIFATSIKTVKYRSDDMLGSGGMATNKGRCQDCDEIRAVDLLIGLLCFFPLYGSVG